MLALKDIEKYELSNLLLKAWERNQGPQKSIKRVKFFQKPEKGDISPIWSNKCIDQCCDS